MQSNTHWYRNAIIYQIYPRSFMDSNGDGIGDIGGIIERLDYLKQLGINGIWLSPIYMSPMKDFGYDISNYYEIDSVFGNLDDFDRLVNEVHRRNLKLVMDLVLNHTSDQHAWFVESKSSKSSPKRDWYIWRDPRPDGSPPNDWQSDFGGSAWTLEPETNQYYLHSFLPQQPDLNWANPEVQMAIQQIMRFWYERGVDGFRVDAIMFSSKNLDVQTTVYRQKAHEKDILAKDFAGAFNHGADQHLQEYIDILIQTTKEYSDRGLFLEIYSDAKAEDPSAYAGLYNYFDNAYAQVFNFGILNASEGWEAQKFKYYVNMFQESLKPESNPVYVLGNHDRSRIASRIGYWPARSAAIALLTLPGTKFMYYGDELGMQNAQIPLVQQKDASNVNRDGARTPMQWSKAGFAGFSKHQPWLPVSDNYQTLNVETELRDPHSILALYRALLTLRESYSALESGSYSTESIDHPDIFAFRRHGQGENILVLINFSEKEININTNYKKANLLISNYMDTAKKEIDLSHVALRPHESWVAAL